MKKILLICMIPSLLLSACGLTNDKHITQSQAEKIANDLVGGEVTFIKSEETEDSNSIDYLFTDSKGYTFTITSNLSSPKIDGATAKYLPLECHVHDNYFEAVLTCNEDKIMDILEDYELEDYLKYSFGDVKLISLEVNSGTPEENQEILNNFVAAGVEIDTLLDMTYDKEYFTKTHYPFYFYGDISMNILFIKIPESADTQERSVRASFDFSTSPDTRWTTNTLYETIKNDLENLEIAD